MATVFDNLDGTRQEKIERYVELSAVGYLIAGGYGLATQELFEAVDFDELTMDTTTALFQHLWPTDSHTEGAEFNIAEARAALLAAKLFERIAAASREEADHFRGLAAKDLAKVAEKTEGELVNA